MQTETFFSAEISVSAKKWFRHIPTAESHNPNQI